MSKIWVDVTVIMSWEGTFTGIQRVVYSYVKRLVSDSTVNVGLFTFDGVNCNEVTYDSFIETLKSNSSKKPKLSQVTLLSRFRAKGIPILKRELKNIKYVGSISANAYKGTRYLYKSAIRVKNVRLSSENNPRKSLFKEEDTVLLIDGNWLDGGVFSQAFVAEKRNIGFNLVHLVNDVISLRNPAYTAKGAQKVIGRYFRRILPVVDVLISISNATIKDIEWFCNKEKISLTKSRHVIRIGDELESLHEKNIVPKKPKLVGGKDSFILTVGTIEVRKNHHLLYYVYRLALDRGIKLPRLVIAGRSGWMSDGTLALFGNDPDLSERVIILNPTDSELAWLYSTCLFTVFPSFYEGWGIPVVESIAHGKVCIASDTSSTPEVVGDLAIYESPYNPQGYLDKIISCMKDEYRIKLEDRIDDNYEIYTWDESAKNLLNIIRSNS